MWDREISIPSCYHTPYALLKNSYLPCYKHQGWRVFRILKWLFWSLIPYWNIFQFCSNADMEGKCKFERVTKYKFLECFAFVCNICSKVREDHENNGEEAKKKIKKKLLSILRHNRNLLSYSRHSRKELEECCVSKIRGKWYANVQ